MELSANAENGFLPENNFGFCDIGKIADLNAHLWPAFTLLCKMMRGPVSLFPCSKYSVRLF